ncbi:MAG: T9SS type A sorting domain-containing protein [Candidatus Fermentibacteraceae bacterium]|nr:T9SS type A sorting domain-containing protein [Candidatus Fermentibacteraceae bacterium]MBN2608898.1 T9SS type A sorting domain-containing protein [Candidatus Fermentibacteraceae bacterium]
MKYLICIVLMVTGGLLASGLSILESSPEGIVFDLSASQPIFRTIPISGRDFSAAVIEGAESTSDFSYPRMPVFRSWIEIPAGATVVSTVSDETILDLNGPAWPIQPGIMSAPKNSPRSSYTMELDQDVYGNGAAYPSEWVRITYAGQMRGRNLALVEVLPLRWDPSINRCQLLSEATVSLTFQGGDLAATYSNASRYYAPPFEEILSDLTVNYGTFESGTDTPPAPYLIIGHEDFVDTGMDDFVTWKESQGFDVTMVDLSVTGTSASQIEAYILDAIENWTNPPVYILLVGDTGYLPGNTATAYSGVTDLYYVTLDDGGYIPDAFIGRFSVTSVGQAVLMADRVINYEQTVTGSTPWVQNTCWIASSDNYSISEGTHNYCIDTYLDPLGYTWDKVYPHSGGTAADAVASINGGVSMLTFSGHGSTTSWGDMSFGISNFNQLNNGDMLPGVLSHACLTGDYSTSTAWCETWTRTPDRGGLWFWGSVPSSYWDEDDIQERGEYDFFLGQTIYWPMGFLNGGKLAVFEYYSGGGRTLYYYEGYNLMGDPSLAMKIWGNVGIGESETPSATDNILVSNPVRSAAVVTLSGNGPSELNVFDVAGRLVATPYRGSLNGSQSMSWDTASLTPGMYFLRLETGGEVSIARVMVIR